MAQRAGVCPRLRAMAVFALAIASNACGDDVDAYSCTEGDASEGDCEAAEAPDCSLYPGPAELSLGLHDGDEINVGVGPGGVPMFDLTLRAKGVYSSAELLHGCHLQPIVATEIWRNGTKVGGSGPTHDRFSERPDGAMIVWHISTLDAATGSPLPAGETYTLRGSVEDACGNQASDAVSVVTAER